MPINQLTATVLRALALTLIILGGSAAAASADTVAPQDYDNAPSASATLTQSGGTSTKGGATTQGTAPRYTVHPNNATSATFRNAGNGYVIGNAYDGWTFDGNSYTNNDSYRGGYLYGNPGVNYCGWIQLTHVSYISQTGNSNCPSGGFQIAPSTFIHEADCSGCGHAQPVNVQCDSFTEFGNSQPWTSAAGANQVRVISGNQAHNYQVSWRYISRNSNWVEVTDGHYNDNQTNHVFITRSCFPSDLQMPPASDGDGLWYP